MKNVCSLLLLIIIFSACKDSNNNNNSTSQNAMITINNPLLAESTLPYGVPDFTKIKNGHFQDAMNYLGAEPTRYQAEESFNHL